MIFCAVAFCTGAGFVLGGEKKDEPKKEPAKAAVAPKTRVLIIEGLPGTSVHGRRYRDWIVRFNTYLTKTAKVNADDIRILSADTALDGKLVDDTANRETVMASAAELVKNTRPEDQVVILIVGHGSSIDGAPKFVVGGPDVNLDELAEALAPLSSKNQLILNFTPASGDTVKSMAAPNRVLLCATSPTESAEPIFMEFFLQALEGPVADNDAVGDNDGKVNMLEAFNWASRECAYFIRRIYRVEDGWKIDGRYSVPIFKKLYTGGADESGARILSPSSNANATDIIPIIVTDLGSKNKVAGQRVLAQHPVIEDAGTEVGLAAIRSGKYQPLDGRAAGEPGALARRVVIGQLALLPPAPPAPKEEAAATKKP
ncbi:MAG: hypothetical protein JXR97_07320 [Planctomycetes bacterium]|nr:hypothetical protein [Planctomycetota bacterium]